MLLRSSTLRRAVSVAGVSLLGAALVLVGSAHAVPAPADASVGLATAAQNSIMAKTSVTISGATVLALGVAVDAAATVSGLTPGVLAGGTLHQGDAEAPQAATDLAAAYDDLATRVATVAVTTDLAALTLGPGVYFSTMANAMLTLNGTLTLDGHDDAESIFVLRASDLTVGPGSVVSLVNGAQACNVFWAVANTATVGTGSRFVGDLLAMSSITVNSGTTVDGRVLSRAGAVSVDGSVFTNSACDKPADGGSVIPQAVTVPVAQSVAVTVSVTAPVAPAPAVSVAGTVAVNELPNTGSDTTMLALIAGALLVLGSAGVAFGRRHDGRYRS